MTVIAYIKTVCDKCGRVYEVAKFTGNYDDVMVQPPPRWAQNVTFTNEYQFTTELEDVCEDCIKMIEAGL